MGLTDSETEDFNDSGLSHLTSIDWKNVDHQRSVAASLVQGAYILERDHQQQRPDSQALAPPWWEFFHFRLYSQLIDDADSSTFGAIYEFKPPASHCNLSTAGVPRYVIAFRGTLIKLDSFERDLALDLRLIRNGLHQTSRFKIAMKAVEKMVDSEGNSNVWLAGHSLGSAVAMLVGKTMAKKGVTLEAFLFNPPFPSVPIESFKNEKVKHVLRITGYVTKAGLACAVKKIHPNILSATEVAFVAMSEWVPRLYVNPADHFCSEYVGHFKSRKKMEEIGLGGIGRSATQHSHRSLVKNVRGKESEPLHLIPSANLIINATPSRNVRQAHGIDQWWKPDLHLQFERYTYE